MVENPCAVAASMNREDPFDAMRPLRKSLPRYRLVRGIGQAIADRLAANGGIVIYSDVNEADARAAAARSPGAASRSM